MRPPRRVPVASAAALDLAADGRDRPPETARDRGERFTAGKPYEYLLAVKDRQLPLPRLPPERLRIDVTPPAGHLPDHRRRADDFSGDVEETTPLRVETVSELLLLAPEQTILALQPMPPHT